MISLSARIGNGDARIITLDINSEKNNVSADISNVKDKIKKSNDIFLLGASKFSEKSRFVYDKLDYYVSQDISNKYGVFNDEHLITFRATNDTSLIFIYFDLYNNAYPKRMLVDDEVVRVNSAVACFPISTTGEHTIRISSWSQPNRPLIIQGMQPYYNISGGQFVSCEFSAQDREDALSPCWGLKSNSGRLDFYDGYGVINNLNSFGKIVGMPIDLYCDCGDRSSQIGGFYISNVSQDKQAINTTVEFQDELAQWQELEVEKKHLTEEMSVMAFANTLNIPLRYDDSATSSFLRSIIIKFPYIEGGSYWAVWTKICEFAMCYISCNEYGKPTIKYDGGR